MVCRRTTVVHLPVGARRQSVHRVDDGASGPQHVRRVQHDAQRAVGVLQSRRHSERAHTGGQHVLDRGLLKAVQQIADRLVDAIDPRHRGDARNHTHLIGGVAHVMGLPQRVATPPPSHVLVDHRHEVDRLARGLAQLDEERRIGGVQQHGGRVWVATQQRAEGTFGVLQNRGISEERLDPAAVLLGQARLGALQHRSEPVPPGHVQPRRVGPLGVSGAVTVTDGQFEVAAKPLQIRHLGDIAEVRLGRRRHGGDDLAAPRRHRVAVAGHLIEQPAAAGCRVVDLMDVSTELAAPGGHAALRLSRTDPSVGAGGVDE